MVKHNSTYTTKAPNLDLKKRDVVIRDNWITDGDQSPFVSLLMGKGRKQKASNTKFESYSTKPFRMGFSVTAANETATTLTVDTTEPEASFIGVGSIIYNPKTKEPMRVTAVTGKELTVVRAFGENVTPQALQDDGDGKTKLINLSRAFEEGSIAPNGTTISKEKVYNYIQTFRDTVKITNDDLLTDKHDNPNDYRATKRTEILQLHKRNIEHAFLFGTPQETTIANGEMLRTTGGILHYIKSHVMSITDPLQFKAGTIGEVMGAMSNDGATGDKVMMAGSGFIDKLNSNAIVTFGGNAGNIVTKYGITIQEIITQYGKLNMLYNPVLSQVYPNMAIFVDLDDLYLRTMQETTLMMNLQTDGYDGVIDNYITKCGLEVPNQEKHAVLTLDF